MTNPVTPFRNNLFASRGCDIKDAVDYAEIMINTFQGPEYAAAKTAIYVLINTIDNAVTQSQGPSPEKIAIIALIDERIAEHKLAREDGVESLVKIWIDENLREKVMDIVADDDIDDQISNWMSNNFDITDYNVDDAIEQWMDNNLDDKVTDAARCLTFTVEVSR